MERSFRDGPGEPSDMGTFAAAIAQALREEYGETPASRKVVGRLTQANERAVKNWFDAKNAPSGENLVSLPRYSDGVLVAVLTLADRSDLVRARQFAGAREKLEKMLALMMEIETQRPDA